MRIHFTGVAGAGMSAAALMMREAGHEVSGSDEDVFPPMSTYVEGLGFPFHRRFDAANLISWQHREVSPAQRRVAAAAANE